jgi:hypothetical protein
LPAPFALPLAYGIRHRAGCLRNSSRVFCQGLAFGAPLARCRSLLAKLLSGRQE